MKKKLIQGCKVPSRDINTLHETHFLSSVESTSNLLDGDADDTESHDLPDPWVLQLMEGGPETVLLATVLLQLDILDRILALVMLLLVFLGGFVTTHVAEEDVVSQWSNEGDWMEWATGAEQWEGQMDQRVTEVTAFSR
jgi:hypothetical protein